MIGTLDLDGADSYLDALLQLYTPASAGKAGRLRPATVIT